MCLIESWALYSIQKNHFIVRSRKVSKPRDLYLAWSLWNSTGTYATLLLMCLSNLKVIQTLWHSNSHLRDFARSHDKTSYHILKQCAGIHSFIAPSTPLVVQPQPEQRYTSQSQRLEIPLCCTRSGDGTDSQYFTLILGILAPQKTVLILKLNPWLVILTPQVLWSYLTSFF